VNRLRPRLLSLVVAPAALAFFAWGCAKPPQTISATPAELREIAAAPLSEEDFAGETHRLLLSSDRSEKTKLLLAGAVQYQLKRAHRLFKGGHTHQAEDIVTGALLLLRHDDELLSATLGQEAPLLEAAHAAARSGDAGRAGALYQLTLLVSHDSKTRSEVNKHLKALTKWNKSTQGSTALEKIGEKTRRSLARSVVDPRADSYLTARDDVISWMRAALASSAGKESPRSRSERDLAMEAYRAIRSGAPALIAINLRQGTPTAAVRSLEEAGLEQAMPPGVRRILEQIGDDDDPEAWFELYRQLESMRVEGGTETQHPKYVADGATLWAAIGLYRSSPGNFEHAMPLAMTLVEFGMPEVASTLLSSNSDDRTSDKALSWALSLVSRGLIELSSTDQLKAARRSYQQADKLLAMAQKNNPHGSGPARARYIMASLESRHGFVERALPLLEKAIAQEPLPEVLLRLSHLQIQQKQLKKGQRTIERSIQLAQKSGDLLLESQGEEALFRLYRKERKTEQSAAALHRSLARILVLKKMELSQEHRAAAERQLARVLEYYGEKREVRAAYERALEASRTNAMELEVTLTEMARSALTHGDLRLARRATQSALDLGLPPENTIYIALWLHLLEKNQSPPIQSLSREIFSQAKETQGWLEYLRKWGLSEVDITHLKERASGIPENVEADFYAVLNRKKLDETALAKVAGSPAIELIEVRIAQDLLAQKVSLKLPQGVKITSRE